MPEDSTKPNPPTVQPGMPEASMEEIIASIGRVIAADSRAPSPARTGEGGGRGILDLTDAIEPDGSIRKLAGAAPPRSVEAAAETRAEPTAPPGGPAAAQPVPARGPLLSAAASEAAAAALGRLGTAPKERPAEPEASTGSGGRTLEAVVRDALDPLLRAWLDEHLPDIVERLVRAEIQRVAHDAGLR
jgi:hypothetical protein